MMSKEIRAERLRGMQESWAGIETLRSLWPLAFPKQSPVVKPLAGGVLAEISAKTGWSLAYTRGVLHGWKLRAAYCKAVLRHDRRWNLDGEEVEEIVGDAARQSAQARLAAIDARALKAAQKQVEKSQRVDAENNSAAVAATGG
jgi:hypothetical protein